MNESIVRPQVPPGHIYVNEKWKNTELFSLLSRNFSFQYYLYRIYFNLVIAYDNFRLKITRVKHHFILYQSIWIRKYSTHKTPVFLC